MPTKSNRLTSNNKPRNQLSSRVSSVLLHPVRTNWSFAASIEPGLFVSNADPVMKSIIINAAGSLACWRRHQTVFGYLSVDDCFLSLEVFFFSWPDVDRLSDYSWAVIEDGAACCWCWCLIYLVGSARRIATRWLLENICFINFSISRTIDTPPPRRPSFALARACEHIDRVSIGLADVCVCMRAQRTS